MKKFFADNMMWLVLAALIIGGYCLYKILKSEGKIGNKEEAAE